ncbi:MAG TPA: response regulator [Polyangiaceae bacterium]|jgi:two-component system chemotaxis response regulator CheY
MSKKIVIVDDSRTARQQVRSALADVGYDVIEAVDGTDGLSKIKGHLDASLVICDVNMPNLNGLDMLAALRAEQPKAVMPVIMLTTEAQPELLQQAKQRGAKGWIVKPFKPEMLVAAVRKLAGAA